MSRALRLASLLMILLGLSGLLAACSHGRVGPGGDGGSAICDICNGIVYVPCTPEGQQGIAVTCLDGQQCVTGSGCSQCTPGQNTCKGNEIHLCGADSTPGDYVGVCDDTQGLVCAAGACVGGCTAAAMNASNVGCEFWAVDLDNEYDFSDNAAGAPWGVVISNAGAATAHVNIELNMGAPNGMTQTMSVQSLDLSPGTVQMVTLPTREVDGTTNGMNNGPGTFLSSNAYRISSDLPLVVYQFNPLRQMFSNDASLLIPTNGLGTDHRIVGYPAANPIDFGFGIVDHSFVTIVGTQANTSVRVKVTTKTLAGGGIPALNPGDTYTGTIGPYDVINLESDGLPADFTGSAVSASAPVAVFSGTESSIAPVSNMQPPPPPGGSGGCCTDHLEEQVWPLTSLGSHFVITRSPIRSDDPATYAGYDVLRFVGGSAAATVMTNLASPDNMFMVQPGELHEVFTDHDVVVDSTAPVLIGQILVSGDYTDTNSQLGDPSLTIFPAVEQFRTQYLFLVPDSFDKDYVVIAQPAADPPVQMNGAPLPAGCTMAASGNLAGVDYVSRTCPVTPGAYQMTGTSPFGITAYGYYHYGSYAFVGGAYVKKIYTPAPIL